MGGWKGSYHLKCLIVVYMLYSIANIEQATMTLKGELDYKGNDYKESHCNGCDYEECDYKGYNNKGYNYKDEEE